MSLSPGSQGEVLSFTDKGMTVDLNHPLAGERLIFELDLVEVDNVS